MVFTIETLEIAHTTQSDYVNLYKSYHSFKDGCDTGQKTKSVFFPQIH